MTRKTKHSDLMTGKLVHYWDGVYQVLWNDGINVCLVVPGQQHSTLYQPYPGSLLKSTSHVVSSDNPFILVFVDKKPWE
jgi:hypothetical protein